MKTDELDEARIARVADLLTQARSVLFITGAGISADSGLPTYRGVGGLYHDRDTEDEVPIEVALSGQVFARQPELTWKYLLELEQASRGKTYNRGHEVIAEIEGEGSRRVWTLTQNVDGFHRAAGAEQVIDIHGCLHDVRCTECAHARRVEDFGFVEEVPPRCPTCEAVLRPDVILFGEQLPEAQLEAYHRELARGFELVVSVGTSSLFPYIAAPMFEAHRVGIPTVEINPGATQVSAAASVCVRAGAAAALDAIWEAAR